VTLFGESPTRELLPYDGSAIFHEWVLGTESHEDLLTALVTELEWEQKHLVMFGREVAEPRLSAWYGDERYTYSGVTLEPRAFTPTLERLKLLCEHWAGSRFNSVLVNLYRNGDDSMGWHADDEPELGVEPVIASLSLGTTRRFKFRHRRTREIVDHDLTGGSLLVMSGASQSAWMHSIPKQKRVADARVNLTFRSITR
jgi:alkylated DNA repair dioxygenase AlkB